MSSRSPAPIADEVLETREASPSHFVMNVESYSLFGQNEIHKYESGEFNAGGHKWRLVLYLNEDKTGINSKYISLHLAISDKVSVQPANWEVNAVFSISLFNQITGSYHYSLGRTRRFQASKSEWGIPKFISKEILMDPSNGFLIDDKCVFGAEVFIVEMSAVSECLSLKNSTVPFKRDWKISNFSKLEDCWTSEQFVVEGLKWQVYLYPKGKDHEKGRCLSIFLTLIDSKRVKAHYSICIKDQKNNKHRKITGSACWFSPPIMWGFPGFMEIATLEDPKNGFIKKNRCLLEIELSVQAVV